MRSLLALAALSVSCLSAHATPITYTASATLSGTIGSTTFTNAAVSITQVGDTSNVFAFATNVYGNTAGMSTITIAGVGTATFLSSTFGAISQEFGPTSQGIGFYDSATHFGVGEESGLAVGYNLQSGLGPLTATFLSDGTQSEATSLGALVITTAYGSGNATVAAATVAATPEPSTFALLGTGLVGFAGLVRKRFMQVR